MNAFIGMRSGHNVNGILGVSCRINFDYNHSSTLFGRIVRVRSFLGRSAEVLIRRAFAERALLIKQFFRRTAKVGESLVDACGGPEANIQYSILHYTRFLGIVLIPS